LKQRMMHLSYTGSMLRKQVFLSRRTRTDHEISEPLDTLHVYERSCGYLRVQIRIYAEACQ
jgi:hypothetical protein